MSKVLGFKYDAPKGSFGKTKVVPVVELAWLEKWLDENTYHNDAGEECLNGDLLKAARGRAKEAKEK